MTPQQIRIVQSTWLSLLPVQDLAAQLFYERLFELNPSLKRLFRGDIREQGKKLMQVIDLAVNGLSRFEQLRPMIQDMGRRHAGYGVQDHHYGTVGAALLWTLEQGLSAAYTAEVRDAWTAAYGVLATTMREAARDQGGQPVQGSAPARGAEPADNAAQGSAGASPARRRGSRVAFLVTALGLAAGIGWGVNLALGGAPVRGAAQSATAATPAKDPGRFLLNALLVPTLDPDALPLRWVDPRRALRCGGNTTIYVDGAAMVPGTLVPDRPFELEWDAQGCRPFGAHGPRVAGRVKFTVYREDWGFSAMVEPTDLRVVSGLNQTVLIEAGAATLPRNPEAADLAETAAACAREPRSCS